jgi:hypothetical protein
VYNDTGCRKNCRKFTEGPVSATGIAVTASQAD